MGMHGVFLFVCFWAGQIASQFKFAWREKATQGFPQVTGDISSCIYNSWSKPKYISFFPSTYCIQSYLFLYMLHSNTNNFEGISYFSMPFLYYMLYYIWTQSNVSKSQHYVLCQQIAFDMSPYNIFIVLHHQRLTQTSNVSCYLCSRSNMEHWPWPLTWSRLYAEHMNKIHVQTYTHTLSLSLQCTNVFKGTVITHLDAEGDVTYSLPNSAAICFSTSCEK